MSLFRLAIVLCVIALFLPSSAEEKDKVYRGVSEAVENVEGFCVRNASLCQEVGAFAGAVANRAYYGAQMVYEAAIGPGQGDQTGRSQERPYPSRFESQPRQDNARARSQPARSTDTLRRDDRAPAWRGPGSS